MAQRTARSRAPANQEGMKSPGRWIREPHVRHRDYSQTLGRFIERDPIGFQAGDNNWYRFAANGPTKFVDPSGQSHVVGGALVGCAAKGTMSAVYSFFSGDSFTAGCCKAIVSCGFGALAGAISTVYPTYAGCAIPLANAGAEAVIKRACSKNLDNKSITCDLVSAVLNTVLGCAMKDVIGAEKDKMVRAVALQFYNGLSKLLGEDIKMMCNFR